MQQYLGNFDLLFICFPKNIKLKSNISALFRKPELIFSAFIILLKISQLIFMRRWKESFAMFHHKYQSLQCKNRNLCL